VALYSSRDILLDVFRQEGGGRHAPPTLTAALALGEPLSASGRQVLAASGLGMEACCRIGMAVHPYRYDKGWHITGTQAAGVREVFGSMPKPCHPGRSAQSGVLAALLASLWDLKNVADNGAVLSQMRVSRRKLRE
jgi:2-methylcitrate dehydratase PrpD